MNLGYPFDRLADAESALLDAQRLAQAAIESGDAQQIELAQMDLEGAIFSRNHAREMVGNAMLLMFRCALETAWGEVFGLVMQFACEADWRKQVEEYMTAKKPLNAMWLMQKFTAFGQQIESLRMDVNALKRPKPTGE